MWYDGLQLDAAEEAASLSIDLLSDRVDQPLVCQCHQILGEIHSSKGETEQAIDHFEIALRIASPFNWHSEQFRAHFSLALLFFEQGRFDDSHAHIKRAKSHAVNNEYLMGRATEFQARFCNRQDRLREARSEILCAIAIYEKVRATTDLERCRSILRGIEEGIGELTTSDACGESRNQS